MTTVTPRARAPAGRRAVAGWATDRFGLITTARLRRVGVSRREQAWMTRHGWLLATDRPGIHRVGHAAFVPGQREALALATAGPGSMLSGWAGATWRGLVHQRCRRVCVLVPGGRGGSSGEVRRIGIAVGTFQADTVRGLRSAPLGRLLMDLAAEAPPAVLREALVGALRTGFDAEPLAQHVRGRRGARRLREELEVLFPQLAHTMSELEVRFLRLLPGAGVPMPVVNAPHDGDLLDCRWPGSRLVVELDGRRWHEHRFEEDRRRDRRRIREGLVTLRFTWRDVTGCPDEVVADVAGVLRADGPPAR